jgi:hypothetical protein
VAASPTPENTGLGDPEREDGSDLAREIDDAVDVIRALEQRQQHVHAVTRRQDECMRIDELVQHLDHRVTAHPANDDLIVIRLTSASTRELGSFMQGTHRNRMVNSRALSTLSNLFLYRISLPFTSTYILRCHNRINSLAIRFTSAHRVSRISP